MGNNSGFLWFLGIVAVLILVASLPAGNKAINNIIAGVTGQSVTPTDTTVKQPLTVADLGCSQNPAYSYSGIDKFSTSTATGTQYIKQNDDKPVSSLANPTYGNKLELWIDNSTKGTNCAIATENSVACGSRSLQTTCYQNGSLTTKVYDDDAKGFLIIDGTAATNADNVTISANGVSNLRLTYQGTSKKPNMPFGGCLAIEIPTTISDVTANGKGISSNNPCKFKYTYAVGSTSNTYKLFDVPAGFDIDALGDLKEIPIQLKAGSSDPSGTAYFTWIPAGYYITNDGKFALGVEKDQNQDTTATVGEVSSHYFTIE